MKARQPLLAMILLACVSGPASAGLFDDGEARQQIFDLRKDFDQRLQKIEASSRGQLDLSNQLEELKAEIARLRGQVEVLNYELQSTEKRQRDFYTDLDSRLRALESGAPQSAAGQAGLAPIDPAAESRDFEAALNLLKAGKNKEAATAFDAFIKAYPGSAFQPTANFWAGNAALQARDAAAASSYFNTLLGKWPDDARAPDAMLGLATSQQALGDTKSSRKTLEALVAKYPNSQATQVARQRLGKP